MKKTALILCLIICTLCFSAALADSNSPVGIWFLACHNASTETFDILILNNDGTGIVYEVMPFLSGTAVCKLRWSLSGSTIKYSVTVNNKGYSSSIPITLSFDANLTFKNGIVYKGKNPMTKTVFYNYSK